MFLVTSLMPSRTVKSSLEERDALLSSLSLELWQREKRRVPMSDRMQTSTYSYQTKGKYQCTASPTTCSYWPGWILHCSHHHSRYSANKEQGWETVSADAICGVRRASISTYVSVFVLMLLLFLWLLMWERGGALHGWHTGRENM